MKLKVLIIDDDEDDYVIVSHYISKIIGEEFDVYWCNDYDFALDEIMKSEHDIYLIDYFLGKGKGTDIIEEARKHGFLKPMILLTGTRDKKIDELALKKGASDFLIKGDLHVDVVEKTLRYATERYRQNKLIQSQEIKYRSLFELSLEPFIVLNENMTISEYNAAFVTIFSDKNNPNEDLRNQDFKSLFKYDFDYTVFLQKLNDQGFVKGFKTILQNNKKDIIALLSIAPLPENKANKNAFHVAISDVTKVMEQEMELKKSEKMLMSGRMARMIAHEIRNPLTNIRLAVEELASIAGAKEEQTMLQNMIKRNSLRISDLIDEVLNSARPPELEKINANLEEIIEAALEICQDRMNLQNVRLIKDIDKNSCEGQWDPERLQIAFVNIITNAIEAMDGVKNPTLSISLGCEENHPVIFIRDNGKGMDVETLNNLFDPFYTNRKNGMGLGMTATLNIINMHNGRITVQSNEGEGTTFTIRL